MITIKRLSECTLDQAAQAWNRGFSGYFTDATTNVQAFVARMGKESISPNLSIVAFSDDRPIGLVLNAIRTIERKKVAWNGGTAVDPDYRGKGIGKILMEATLDIYRNEQVDVATLEAIAQNERAIKLYEKMGYEIVDRLVFLRKEQQSIENSDLFAMDVTEHATNFAEQSKSWRFVHGIPQGVAQLPFYKGMSAWQTQWKSLLHGESYILYDPFGEPAGYALFERSTDSEGNLTKITLLQCEVRPDYTGKEQVGKILLNKVFALKNQLHNNSQESPYVFSTFNFPASNQLVLNLLQAAGFVNQIEQVFMVRKEGKS